MPNYRRNYVPGATYFFTLVTHDRRPFLTTELARTALRNAISKQQSHTPFDLVAIVLLPDHLHAIWTLHPGDSDFSTKWSWIKSHFTRLYLTGGGRESDPSVSRQRHRERGVWQRRFWEHTVRDDTDFSRCLDYLHYNPVKHGLTPRVRDYQWSTFAKFVEMGEYEENWGEAEVASIPGAEFE
jgi:putative transposase